MRRWTLAALVFCSAAVPAAAVDVPPLADQLLWCSSAFYWLSASASDAGDSVEADQYNSWSDLLAAQGHDLLVAAGLDEAAISTRMDDFDSSVAAELGTDKARFDVRRCPELVGPVSPATK